MKNNKIIYKKNIDSKYLSSSYDKKLNKKYNDILKFIILNLNKKDNNFYSLSNKFELNFKKKDVAKFKKFKSVAIIGMGGSILGAQAIYSFLEDKIKKKFLFFNNINEVQVNNLKKKGKLNKILFIVVSKSGKTIETISNFYALKILKKNAKNIIVISEKFNFLHQLSETKRLFHVEHKKHIGGRYSVLSEVGMLPAYLMGISIEKLRKNLLVHFKKEKKRNLKSSSIILASLLKSSKFKNLIFCNFEPKLDKFLDWNQQLIAESLGKKQKGFLPVISKSPKDHHSLLQLFLDGPKDKVFYIFSSETKNKNNLKIKNLDTKLKFLNNKSLKTIKEAQREAFVNILKKNEIPFREFKIKDFSEETLGELFSYFMLETAIIGKLSNLNPYNQPAVEQVKVDTRKLLI